MSGRKYKPSVLLAIFRRKGGEGAFTKIIREENKLDFHQQTACLQAEEQPLLCFKQNELNWLLITSERIMEEKEGVSRSIPFAEIVEVSLALQEEYKDGVMNTIDFTRLLLKDGTGKNYTITLEQGAPFKGIYQMLHFIA